MNITKEELERMATAASYGLKHVPTVNLNTYQARCRDIVALVREVNESTALLVEMNRRLNECDAEWREAHEEQAAEEATRKQRRERRWMLVDEDGEAFHPEQEPMTTREKNAHGPIPAGMRWQEVSE